MKILLLIICALTLLSCKSTNETDQKVEPTTEQVEAYNVRFIVSFISIGSGIDNKAKSSFVDLLKSKDLEFNSVNWGREGEFDYCLKLDELDSANQVSFIEEVKQLLSGSELVRYKENATCRQDK
ncbi:MAG: hypothetical protein WC121_12960 [Candidatus Kapaibacterium sp.]